MSIADLLVPNPYPIQVGAITAPSITAATELLQQPTNLAVTLAMKRTSDSFNRYQMNSDGVTEWGPGASQFDTVLQRSAPGKLVLTNAAGNPAGGTLETGAIQADTSLTMAANTVLTFAPSAATDSCTMNFFSHDGTNGGVRFASAPNGTDQSEIMVGTVQLNTLRVQNPGITGGQWIQILAGLGLAFQGGTSGRASIIPPAIITSYSLTIPAAQGGANTVLQNNGSGITSWGPTITTVTPADANNIRSGTLSISWAAIGKKRTVTWVGSGTWTANNTGVCAFIIDSSNGFGTPIDSSTIVAAYTTPNGVAGLGLAQITYANPFTTLLFYPTASTSSTWVSATTNNSFASGSITLFVQ